MFWSLRRTPNYEEVVLRGEKVHLRPLLIEDAEEMYLFVRDPEVTRYLPWEPAVSVDTVRPFLQEQVGRRRRGESIGFAILDNATGKMIGSTDLMDLKAQKGHAELGYLLDRGYWGQGMMTEAARLTIDFAFECLKLNRITAWADADNLGSRRVLEKIGMTQNASEVRIVKEATRSYIGYQITRPQWEGKR